MLNFCTDDHNNLESILLPCSVASKMSLVKFGNSQCPGPYFSICDPGPQNQSKVARVYL